MEDIEQHCTLAFRATKSFRHAINTAAGRRMLSQSDYTRLALLRALKEDGVSLDQQAAA
jgi:hypothetical protein